MRGKLLCCIVVERTLHFSNLILWLDNGLIWIKIDKQLSEDLDRRSIWSTSTRLQEIRRGVAGWAGNRCHPHDQHSQGHHQQHEGQGPRNGGHTNNSWDYPGSWQWQQEEEEQENFQDQESLLLLGNQGTRFIRVVQRDNERGCGDGWEGCYRAAQLLHKRVWRRRRQVCSHNHASVPPSRQERRGRGVRDSCKIPLCQAQLATSLQEDRYPASW